jgi:hypothetical protein
MPNSTATSNPTRWARRGILGIAGLGLLSSLYPALVQAQAAPPPAACPADAPCDFQIEPSAIQRVPTTFKLQAKISQAKMPIGEAKFEKIFVNLLSGTAARCTEVIEGVQVYDGVLNLDIGRNMGCSLDDEIAKHTDLSFQICIESQSNCLKPIALSTVPFAVKSTFALKAQEAFKAQEAAQAHYAHRVTADRDLFANKTLGTGYYDFHSPRVADDNQVAGLKLTASETYQAAGGYLQWAPVNGSANTLNICAKNNDSDQLTRLGEVVFHSDKTTARGSLFAANGGLAVQADLPGTPANEGQFTCSLPTFYSNTVTFGIPAPDQLPGFLAVFNGPVQFNGRIDWGPNSSSDLPDNFVSGGPGGSIVDLSITDADLADRSITSIKIADGTVATADLANSSVSSAKIADGTIATADLASASVTSDKIANATIVTADLANACVTSAQIADGAVGTADLANSSVTSAKIADGTVATSDLANASVTGTKIAARSVTNDNLQLTNRIHFLSSGERQLVPGRVCVLIGVVEGMASGDRSYCDLWPDSGGGGWQLKSQGGTGGFCRFLCIE